MSAFSSWDWNRFCIIRQGLKVLDSHNQRHKRHHGGFDKETKAYVPTSTDHCNEPRVNDSF
jgi:hypothetical protein